SLTEKDNFLTMEIRDNGRGITDDQLASYKSFGLMGIHERVDYMRGDAEIGRTPQGGTRVGIRIPIRQDKGDIK
ncbi:MAG: ATP-binding protein, partial [Nitrospirota bacterium]